MSRRPIAMNFSAAFLRFEFLAIGATVGIMVAKMAATGSLIAAPLILLVDRATVVAENLATPFHQNWALSASVLLSAVLSVGLVVSMGRTGAWT